LRMKSLTKYLPPANAGTLAQSDVNFFSLAPASRKPLFDVVSREHLLAKLPPLIPWDDIASIAQVEGVRTSATLRVIPQLRLEPPNDAGPRNCRSYY
jgi:hypothetical protein